MTAAEVQHVRWAGWAILSAIALGWVSWVSLIAINNQTGITTHTERIDLHYQQLHGDLSEVKNDVKTLLQESRRDSGFRSQEPQP